VGLAVELLRPLPEIGRASVSTARPNPAAA
jgi:hypothetical protein